MQISYCSVTTEKFGSENQLLRWQGGSNGEYHSTFITEL